LHFLKIYYILWLVNKPPKGAKGMSVFGNKVKRLRENKGLSTRMLAEIIGVSHGQISKYERGVHEPTLSVLIKYKEYFNVSLDYLCDDSKE
jgi:transcriptional regulator with XRE-family HTH domain